MTNKISRRNFLKGALAVGGAVAAGGIARRLVHDRSGRDFRVERSKQQLNRIFPVENPSELPNIIIIFVDDMGYGDLFGYGAELMDTPNLDRMASEGVRMRKYYSTAPVCTPSRVGLLTGRYPIRTHMVLPQYPTGHPMGLFLNAIGRYQYGVTGLPEDELLLPELLSKRGYRTALVGKWHLGDHAPHLPNDNGFDNFYGPLYSNDMDPFLIYRDDQVEIPEPVDQSLLTRNYTSEAVRFIEENAKEPFFLYLAHTMVHEPIHASDEFKGKSAAGLYGDAVMELDWSVGEILRTLQVQGLDENTLVIFTSDNGPWWQGSAGGLRGRKNNLMEGGFRVPFIARWPGILPAGEISDEVGISFDLFVTCLGIAGIPLPDDRVIDGVDILPVLQGKAPSQQDTFYYYFGHELVAVRHNQWKYHRRYMSDNGGYPTFKHGPFLFDLDRDPAESYDLIDSEPEIARKLAGMLDDWEAQIDANTRGWLP